MRKFHFASFILAIFFIIPEIIEAQEFTEKASVIFPEISGGKVNWGDFDNDGDSDVLLSGHVKNGIDMTYIYNNDNGNLTLSDIQFENLREAEWIDFDNDGNIDIYGLESNEKVLYKNAGNGVFENTGLTFPSSGSGVDSWKDFDGDNDLDLICMLMSNRIIIYTNNGNNTFSSQIILRPNIFDLAWGDLDNDNDFDIITTDIIDHVISTKILRNNNGTFVEESTNIKNYDGFNKFIIEDYNDDGLNDILVNNAYEVSTRLPSVHLYINEGSLNFVQANIDVEGIFGGPSLFVDYNNDGKKDIFMSGYYNQLLEDGCLSKLYKNEGNDIFTEVNANIMPTWYGVYAWGDIENDGDLDLIIYGKSSKTGGVDTKLYINNLITPNCLASATITVSDAAATQNTNFTVPITTTEITTDCNMSAFQFVVSYDNSKMDYVGFNQAGTLSEGSMVVVNSNTPGILNVVMASGSPAVTGVGSLVDLEFTATSCESSTIEISDFYYNTESNTNLVNGTVTVSADYNVTVNDAYGIVGKTFSTAVSVSELFAGCNTGEYSFTLNYDDSHIEYTTYDVTAALDPSATVAVDNSTSGQLLVNVTSSGSLSGIGDLIYLEFNTLTQNTSILDIENFVLDGQQAITMTDGTVTSYSYGDLDNNGIVMGMDASIVLQYSVDPNQVISGINFPWEDWRIAIADVNADGSINSTDAVLIMQYAAGMITEFPAESSKKSTSDFQDVELSVEMVDGNLVFTTSAGLLGFDLLSVDGDVSKLGEPENLSNMMLASNTKDGNYKIAMARAMANEETEAFLSIPVGDVTGELTFNMLANNYTKTYTYKAGVTSVEDLKLSTGFLAYPNPVNTELNLKFKLEKTGNVSIRILDNTGKLVEQLVSNKLSAGEHQYNWSRKGNAAGIYYVEFINGKNTINKKIILK